MNEEHQEAAVRLEDNRIIKRDPDKNEGNWLHIRTAPDAKNMVIYIPVPESDKALEVVCDKFLLKSLFDNHIKWK